MSQDSAHLNGSPWQYKSKVGSYLLNGFREFSFSIFDDMPLIKDTIIEFYISVKQQRKALLQIRNTHDRFKWQYALKEVDVISNNIIRGDDQIVFFHQVLQPEKKILIQLHKIPPIWTISRSFTSLTSSVLWEAQCSAAGWGTLWSRTCPPRPPSVPSEWEDRRRWRASGYSLQL